MTKRKTGNNADDSREDASNNSATPPADLAIGSFSNVAPWIVDPDTMTWRRGITKLRERTQADVPNMIRRRKLPPGIRVIYVGFSIGSALLRWRFVERRRYGAKTSESRAAISKNLRVAFETLGPTYIKLGQIISSGEGIFPDELVREFRLLRDRVKAEPFEDIKVIVERELGDEIAKIFSSFDEMPLAAASIAQVHRATLRTGEEVVVKVQRPAVNSLVRSDLAAMSWFAPKLIGRIPIAALANPPALVELFAETISEELDFRLEAENMLDIARVFADTNQRAIVVPRPHPKLVTKRVLVMERLDGFSFDDVEGMRAAGIDTSTVVRAGLVGFLEGALLYGVFHGDLHGGNLLVRRDGSVALLDFGITGRLSEAKRVAFLRLLLGGTTNDVRSQLRALCELGAFPLDTDIEAVVADLELDSPAKDPTMMAPDELIKELRELTKKMLGYGARLPKELMLFVKNMLFLDGAMATMAPDLDLFAEITYVATYFATTHGEQLSRDVGIQSKEFEVDLTGFRNAIGVDQTTDAMTYRELQARRALIRTRMEDHQRDVKQRVAKRLMSNAKRKAKNSMRRMRDRGHPRS